MESLRFYLRCCLCFCVSSFGTFPVLPISCPIPSFYAQIPYFYANIPCYLGVYAQYRAWCAGGRVRVGLGAGGSCVASRRMWPHTWFYLGVNFNLLAPSPILGTSPAPVPAGDWGDNLRRSSVRRTS